MDKVRRGLARSLAYLYVYARRFRYAILTVMVLLFFFSPSVMYEINGWLYVMLDPGHGGDDPGCNFGKVMEKDVTMQVAKKVAILLEQHKVKIVFAREGDATVDKYDRVRHANREKVDIYVSIHCNSLERGTMQGIETYWGPWKREGQFLATAIHNATVKTTNANDIFVRSKEFAVVRHTKMASALIEIGYLSDPEERKKIDFIRISAIGSGRHYQWSFGICSILSGKRRTIKITHRMFYSVGFVMPLRLALLMPPVMCCSLASKKQARMIESSPYLPRMASMAEFSLESFSDCW